MSAGTKIFLSVFALIVGVLVVYYGVMAPPEPAGAGPVDGAHSPAVPELTAHDAHAPVLGHAAAPPLVVVDDRPMTPSAVSADAALGPLGPIPNSQPDLNYLSAGPAMPAETGIAPEHAAAESSDVVPPDLAAAAAVKANEPVALNPPLPANRTVEHSPAPSPNSIIPMVTEYIVQSGDTMSSIAEEWFGETAKWTLIAKANPLVDPTRMQIGQKLRLPGKESGTVEPARAGAGARGAKPQASPEAKSNKGKPVYVVREGDTLAKIAREQFDDYNMWEQIYKANRSVIGDDPAALKPGMKLTLPAKR